MRPIRHKALDTRKAVLSFVPRGNSERILSLISLIDVRAQAARDQTREAYARTEFQNAPSRYKVWMLLELLRERNRGLPEQQAIGSIAGIGHE
jgi:hypothetical protein